MVLDSCGDDSADIARTWKQHVDRQLVVRGHRYGRLTGRTSGGPGPSVVTCSGRVLATIDLERVWLATTDADSRVPPTGYALRSANTTSALTRGRAGSPSRSGHAIDWPLQTKWQRTYDAEARPIHGASFGVIARDVRRRRRLSRRYARAKTAPCTPRSSRAARTIHYDASAPVVTSARRTRAHHDGFAQRLTRFDASREVDDCASSDSSTAQHDEFMTNLNVTSSDDATKSKHPFVSQRFMQCSIVRTVDVARTARNGRDSNQVRKLNASN